MCYYRMGRDLGACGELVKGRPPSAVARIGGPGKKAYRTDVH